MIKKISWIYITIVSVLLTGCIAATPIVIHPTAVVPTSTSTVIPAVTATSAPTEVTTPTNMPTEAETATATSNPPSPTPNPPTATVVSSPTSSPGEALPDYLDDRSTSSGLILSLFNAINRKEYLRAYSYWINPSNDPEVGTFEQFQEGYQNTASVQVTLGTVGVGAGAGQVYYTVPVVLKAETTGGRLQTFSGCYTLHMSNPQIQAEPPFHPLGIVSAQVYQVDNSSNSEDLLSNACPAAAGSLSPSPTTDPTDISASNYLDDRSGPVEVLRSLFNAINSKEYARAYSYWQNTGEGNDNSSFSKFEQGYQNTASVEAVFGEVTSDVGAGQLRFRVPTTLKVQTTDGGMQTFVGCYQLHLAQPAIQATPPFRPLGIERASVKQVANDADTAGIIATACQNMP